MHAFAIRPDEEDLGIFRDQLSRFPDDVMPPARIAAWNEAGVV